MEFRDQSQYINEQVIAFDEKLALSVGVRADRGSANGDRAKYYTFPKYSASYRFVEPLSFLTSKIDEVKFRASYGQSGNRPNYGVRDITIASGGVIGGAATLVAANRVGNPDIKPEVMNETELGVDAALFRGRVSIEASKYERVIKDLLVDYPAGAELRPGHAADQRRPDVDARYRGGLSLVPISTREHGVDAAHDVPAQRAVHRQAERAGVRRAELVRRQLRPQSHRGRHATDAASGATFRSAASTRRMQREASSSAPAPMARHATVSIRATRRLRAARCAIRSSPTRTRARRRRSSTHSDSRP